MGDEEGQEEPQPISLAHFREQDQPGDTHQQSKSDETLLYSGIGTVSLRLSLSLSVALASFLGSLPIVRWQQRLLMFTLVQVWPQNKEDVFESSSERPSESDCYSDLTGVR